MSVVLGAVFLLAAAFYLWTAGTSIPLALNGAHLDPYNQLANAFLHLRLSVGRAPAALAHLPEPYNPARYKPFEGFHGGIHDFALYRGNLYLTWGPAPVIVLLVPMHLLGLEPSASVTVSVFAILGTGFALATLRVILRQIGEVPLWICALSAFTLVLASAVPFIVRSPAVYEEAVSGGYCFAMAAIWLAISAMADRQASLRRLALMSLCIGLATGSRPTLAFTAVLLVPVYLSLRTTRPRRGLPMALTVPLGVCVLLLLAYNQARFGNPLEIGSGHQLNDISLETAHFGDISFVLPGLWYYVLNAPRIAALFPFILLTPPPTSYPAVLPGAYRVVEPTGGLLLMAPITIFLFALPWILRRRTTSLARLVVALLMLAGAGVACMLFLAYTFYSATERYTVDFTSLFLLGALAAWVALSSDARGWPRRLVRAGGGVLAGWSCIAGLAISFTGYGNPLNLTHHGTWETLQNIGSPVSRAIAAVDGGPVLAEVAWPEVPEVYVGQQKELVIVSPDVRTAVLHADWLAAAKRGAELISVSQGASVRIHGPRNTSTTVPAPPGGEVLQIPVHLMPGINRITIAPLPTKPDGAGPAIPISAQLLYIESLSLEGG